MSLPSRFNEDLRKRLRELLPTHEWEVEFPIGRASRERVDVGSGPAAKGKRQRFTFIEVELRREDPASNILKVWSRLEAVRLKLSARERLLLSPSEPVDAFAHDAVLQGRYWWNRRSRESIGKAREWFERALGRDPDCAPALGGLADCYVFLPITSDVAAREAFPKAEEAARRALEVDGTLAQAMPRSG